MDHIKPRNYDRYERLRTLSPLAAVEAWLDGDFGIGDEPAMIEAIRRDPRVTLPDDQISNVIMDGIDQEIDAATILERLVQAK